MLYLCRRKIRRKTRDERRTDAAEREQRVLAHFAEPQGGKACASRIKDERRETKDERRKLMGPMGLIRPMGLMGTIGFS